MKITAEPIRNIFGKRQPGFKVSFAGFEATGETKAQAEENFVKMLERQEMYNQTTHGIRAIGATFVLSYRLGWQYQIFCDECADRPSCCLCGQDFEKAKAAMIEHVRQWNEALSPDSAIKPIANQNI